MILATLLVTHGNYVISTFPTSYNLTRQFVVEDADDIVALNLNSNQLFMYKTAKVRLDN